MLRRGPGLRAVDLVSGAWRERQPPHLGLDALQGFERAGAAQGCVQSVECGFRFFGLAFDLTFESSCRKRFNGWQRLVQHDGERVDRDTPFEQHGGAAELLSRPELW